MLNGLLTALRASTSNDSRMDTKRRYPRRTMDRCVAVIHGQSFPVYNWSLGGTLIAADDRLFSINSELDITMKFKLRNTIIDVNHQAQIVRKSDGQVALQFSPLTSRIRRSFQQVIDDHIARQFATSQV